MAKVDLACKITWPDHGQMWSTGIEGTTRPTCRNQRGRTHIYRIRPPMS